MSSSCNSSPIIRKKKEHVTQSLICSGFFSLNSQQQFKLPVAVFFGDAKRHLQLQHRSEKENRDTNTHTHLHKSSKKKRCIHYTSMATH